MRHAKKGRALGTDASHTRAMLRSLAAAVLTNERIKTTEARAKEVRPLVENIITWASVEMCIPAGLRLRSWVIASWCTRVFADIAPRYAEREGGYTRILKLGPRKGDAAPMVILELVD